MKPWKITQIVGFALLVSGVVVRAGTGDYVGTGIGMLGVLVFAVGRCGAWLRSEQP